MVNIAPYAIVETDGTEKYSDSFVEKVNDGDYNTRWNAANDDIDTWIKFTWNTTQKINRIHITEFRSRIRGHKIEYGELLYEVEDLVMNPEDANASANHPNNRQKGVVVPDHILTFRTVETKILRYHVTRTTGALDEPSLYEIEIYGKPVEPKVVEIPKKLQEPVAQKTEGDKTVCEKVCEGLVAYFSFNGNTKDVTGNNNEGNIVGAKLTKDKHGKINNAYMFNGKNYIKLETNNLNNNDNSFSISIISNTIGFSDKYKYSSRAGSSYTSQELLKNSNRTVHIELFYFSDGGRDIGFYVGEKTVWGGLTSINDYHHIVVIADGLNKEIKIYLDGKIKETKKWSNTSVSGKNDWILGGNFGERGYIGVIDEIRFYDKALTTEEVRNIYINYF